MKNIFNITTAIILLLTAISCSDDFMNETLDIPTSESVICISPEWGAGDFILYFPEMENADFEIQGVPSWLQINVTTGKLVNSMATVHCSVTKNPDFEKVGVYLDKMKVSANKRTFYVPIAYVTEGNPVIQVEKTLTLRRNNNLQLQIGNSGEGILMWDIVSLPDWLRIDVDRFKHTNTIRMTSAQYSSTKVPLALNDNVWFYETLTGNIVLRTNDKNNPTVEIKVTAYY